MINIPKAAQIPALSYHCVVDSSQFNTRLRNSIADQLTTGRRGSSGKAPFIVDMILRDVGLMTSEANQLLCKHPALTTWHDVLGVRNDLVDDNIKSQLYMIQAMVRTSSHNTDSMPYNPVGAYWTRGYTIVPGGGRYTDRLNLRGNPKYAELIQPVIDKLYARETLHLNFAGGAKQLIANEHRRKVNESTMRGDAESSAYFELLSTRTLPEPNELAADTARTTAGLIVNPRPIQRPTILYVGADTTGPAQRPTGSTFFSTAA